MVNIAPTLAEVTAYLAGTITAQPGEIDSARLAEIDAQANACRVPGNDTYRGEFSAGAVYQPGDVVNFAGDYYQAVDLSPAVALGAPDEGGWVSVSDVFAPGYTTYPRPLVEALCRRVAHNLAVRRLPLGVQVNISDMNVATNRVAGLDAEVARLEAPYRKMILG